MNLGPIIAALIAGVFWGEKIHKIDIISSISAFMGVIILSFGSKSD